MPAHQRLRGAPVSLPGILAPEPSLTHLTAPAGIHRFESDGDVGVDIKTVENLCILKRASLTAGQPVPAMHLRTENGVTSLYEAGEGHIFAVCCEMHLTSAELFDGEAAEASIREDLRELSASLATLA